MKNKFLFSLFLCILLAFSISCPVSADMGPKPMVTIRVKNPPEGTYYLDLLITGKPGHYENLSEEELANADPELLAGLRSLSDQGWNPALLDASSAPLGGSLTGELDGTEMVHIFSYLPPDEFRIILAAEGGKTVVSDVVNVHVFRTTIRFDAETGEVSQVPWQLAYPFQYLSTLIPTLILESIIFLLFGFSLKRHWGMFLLLNAATQLLLYLLIWSIKTAGAPQIFIIDMLYQIPAELVITAIEAFVFYKLLPEKGKTRRVLCAICANVASYTAGLFLANPIFEWMAAIF
ncbi:MAG: hypothetical protein ACOX6P_01860 [Candidatus Merdivicinus sp.]|jgi:hypothetical protein